MDLLSNRKGLRKLGVAGFLIFLIVLVGLFVFNFITSVFATSYNVNTGISVILNSPSNASYLSNNSFVSGAPFRNINFTYTPTWNNTIVPKNVTLYGNFTGSWVANTTNTTPLTIGNNGTINGINISVPSDGVYVWNMMIFNQSSDLINDTNTANWTVTVDTVAPVLNNTTPANRSFINGSSSQLFQVNGYDNNFNYTNVTLYWRSCSNWPTTCDGWNSPVTLTCYNSTLANTSFVCNNTVNLEGVIPGRNISYYFETSDKAANYGSNGTASASLVATIDRTYPLWSSQSVSVASGSEYAPTKNFGFQIDWTNGLSGIAATTFESNFSGSMTNYSTTCGSAPCITKSGNTYHINFTQEMFANASVGYAYRWYANDSVTPGADVHWNSSSQWAYSIIKNQTNPLNIYLNDSTANLTVIYPAQVNATVTAVYTNSGTPAITRVAADLTQTDVTNDNKTNVRLGNGTYMYVFNISGNANYTTNSTGANYTVFVNKGTVTINLTLNGTNGNASYVYPQAINATGWKSSTTGSEYNLSLYKDGSIVSSTTAADSVSQEILLPNGTYNYTLAFNGSTNYTDTSISTNRFVLVNKGESSLNLLFNGTSTNVTIAKGTAVNMTVTLNHSIEGNTTHNVTLYVGGALYNSSTSLTQIENATVFSNAAGSQINITGYYPVTQNYSSSSEELYVIIESTPPTWSSNLSNVTNNTVFGKYQGLINISAIWNDTFALNKYWLWYNESSVAGTNRSFESFVAGNFSNYTINPSTFNTGIVFQARIYANDTSGNENATPTYQWTIDGTVPTLNATTPVNATYINGSSSELFRVYVYDDTLNTSNVSLYWKVCNPYPTTCGGWQARVALTCELIAGSTVGYNCNNTVNLYTTASNGDTIAYYFEATDKSRLYGSNGTAADPLQATIARTAPQYSNNATNVTVVGKYDGVLISANWTTGSSLNRWTLETNETGCGDNPCYNRTSSTTFGSGTWSNFSWSNSSLSAGAVVRWRIHANDTVGLSNVTANGTFSIDNTKPQFITNSSNVTNTSTIARNTVISLLANWTDNIGLDKYWLSTNATGNWANATATAFATNNNSNSSGTATASAAVGKLIQAYFFANDTSGNENSSEVWQWTIDGTVPTWYNNITNVTNGTTIAKGIVINLTADWNDNLQLHMYWVESNETGSWVNGSASSFTSTNQSDIFIATAGSDFSAGKLFGARIYANDTSNNTNVTGSFYWTIDGTVPTYGLITAANSSLTNTTKSMYVPSENYYFNISVSDNINVSAVTFEWNGSNESTAPTTVVRNSTGGNFSFTKSDLGVSTANYTFRWFVNDTSNNSVATPLFTFNITRNTSTSSFIGLALNGTENNVSYVYPQAINATGWRNFTETGNLSLWRNDSIIDSTTTASSVSQQILLGNNTYNYSLTFEPTNYTSASITVNRFAFINKGSTNISLWINSAQANATMPQGSNLNITATVNTTYDVTLNISTSIASTTGGWVNRSTTGTRIENVSSSSTYTVANQYNITAHFDGDGNFTTSSQTYYLNITQDVAGPTVLLYDDGLAAYNLNNTTARRSGTGSINLNVSVADAGVGVTIGQSCYASIGGSTPTIFATYSGSTSSGWCNGTITIPSLQDGPRQLNITVNDTNTNTGFNQSFYITVDSTPPIITISEPANGTYKKLVNYVWINGTISDNLQTGVGNISVNDTRFGIYLFNGTNSTSFAIWNTSGVDDGIISLKLNYSDNATNIGNSTVYFYEDNTVPTATGLTTGFIASGNKSIQVRVADNLMTNSTMTLKYWRDLKDDTDGDGVADSGEYQTATMTLNSSSSLGTSSDYIVYIYIHGGNEFVKYYVEGTDNTTNTISATSNNATNPLATLNVSTNGIIQGYIKANGTNIVLVGATVSDGTRAAVSNNAGFYQIRGIPEGTYTVTANLTNYVGNSSSASVSVGQTTNLNITLANNATGITQGYVYLTNSSIVPNGTVYVSDGTRTTPTNTAGLYQITGVPAGTYTLTVSGIGYWTNSTSVTVTADTTTSQNMRVIGAENFNITIPGTVGSSNTGFFDAGWQYFKLSTNILNVSISNYTMAYVSNTINGNFTIIYRWNSTAGWNTYVPGAAQNDLSSVASSSDDYYIYMNRTDRVEIGARYT